MMIIYCDDDDILKPEAYQAARQAGRLWNVGTATNPRHPELLLLLLSLLTKILSNKFGFIINNTKQLFFDVKNMLMVLLLLQMM